MEKQAWKNEFIQYHSNIESQNQVFQLSELQACCEDQNGWTRHTISRSNFSNFSG